MRAPLVLLGLAVAFGLAAMWQSKRSAEHAAARELAARAQAGQVAVSESGLLEPGEASIVIGRPAGIEMPQRGPETGGAAGEPQPAPPATTPPAPEPDFTVTVEPGQSLSKIAREHYGTAPIELVRSLARYNGLPDENAIRAGQALKLPPIEALR
ncbi:MAG: LysM domain-containing protein [Planctomycetota bacterium]|nr:LysM domain-containing protein [Planctomycetota bacterium]